MLFHFGGRDQVQDPVPKMTRAFQSLFGWSSLSVCQTQHLTIRGSGRSRADASQKLHAPIWQLRRKVHAPVWYERVGSPLLPFPMTGHPCGRFAAIATQDERYDVE